MLRTEYSSDSVDVRSRAIYRAQGQLNGKRGAKGDGEKSRPLGFCRFYIPA